MLKFKTVNITFFILLILLVVFDQRAPLPFFTFVILISIYLIILVYGSAVLSIQFFLPVTWRGEVRSNAVALTFDDGPIPGNTEKILEILKLYKIQAAFFCIGNRIADHPDLAKRIHEDGHLLGNHSYWHRVTFDLQTARKIEQELIDTDDVIQRSVGIKPNFFRPPFGVSNPMVAKAVKKRGYRTIGWSVRSMDTLGKNSSIVLDRVTKSVKGGDIILLHDYSSVTLEVLPALLDHVLKVGLKIVRLDILLNEKPYG
jgi:peptidoglycan/xylan/chitin deacetylase (PgdA/CDA1 family)